MIIAAQKGEPSPKILTVISATIVERGSVASCSPRADG